MANLEAKITRMNFRPSPHVIFNPMAWRECQKGRGSLRDMSVHVSGRHRWTHETWVQNQSGMPFLEASDASSSQFLVAYFQPPAFGFATTLRSIVFELHPATEKAKDRFDKAYVCYKMSKRLVAQKEIHHYAFKFQIPKKSVGTWWRGWLGAKASQSPAAGVAILSAPEIVMQAGMVAFRHVRLRLDVEIAPTMVVLAIYQNYAT